MANLKHQPLKKYHIVYQTTNIVNGNIYIGVHSTNDLSDGYLGSGDNILKAIKKYGKHNFKREVLHIFSSPEEMLKIESELVTEDFIKRPDVYNIVPGGYGGTNKGSTGLKHLHNPTTGERCAVHESAIQKMLNDGWKIGRNISSTTGTVWVHKNKEKKMILPKVLEDHIQNGWILGMPKSPTSGKKWIFNPLTEEYSLCEVNEIEKYLSEGWIKKKWSPIPLGTIREKIKCDYCGKLADQGNYNRWHGINCKTKDKS